MSTKRIQSALISVFHKEGLEPIAASLKAMGVQVYSTGGTQKRLEELGLQVTAVEDLTGYSSILGGRVKTLHPAVFGGILSRRESIEDANDRAMYNIPEIDLVIVDLYPFEDITFEQIVEVPSLQLVVFVNHFGLDSFQYNSIDRVLVLFPALCVQHLPMPL